MEKLILKARAKINLGLDVLAKRPDGYHELRMVMQSIALSDEIHLTAEKEPGIRLWTDAPGLPADGKNLAYRAAALLMEEFGIRQGLKIDLYKRIPMAAGLAGGSTDAAAVLKGVSRMFGLGLSGEELQKRGVRLGADIPYCVMMGTALAEGIGEKLTRLSDAPPCHVLLVKPPFDVPTGFVYGNLKADRLKEHPDIDGQIAAIEKREFQKMADLMGNVLETVTIPAHPVIGELKDEMKSLGAAGAMMSGSGPTVFGLFEEEGQARNAYEQMRRRQEDGCAVILTRFCGAAG